MAESLLLPVVRGVLGKAADALVQTVTRMWGVDDDRRKLERHLLSVQCLLADAEVKSETNPAVKAWMRELKAAAYQADDVLDDFQYEALRREAQAGESTAAKVQRYFSLHSPILFRLTVSRNLNSVLKRINDLVTEMHTFSLVERTEAPQALYRQTHSALDESADIFGRDDDKEVVVKLLLEQHHHQNVQVLPIIGMGGLGKTTLAKMLYNDHRVQKHFELKMWHCVSEDFEATAVVRSVVELASNGRCDLPDTMELLRKRLQDVIGRKRFILVLDDVWNEEPQKWEEDLRPLLCSSIGGMGSVIVVTSRSPKAASIMGTFPPHQLACLSENDSWELFSKKAFSKGLQKQAELITIGKLIVNKCKGLPLALKTMGGLMSSKHQIKEWEDIAESDRGNDAVMSILKLSYRHLSSEMKQCFTFCAVFPKDYVMDKDKLIQLWTANNFIHAEETIDLAQKGEFVFNELVWRSFIQDVNGKIFDEYSLSPYKGIGCKMHDLMHDLAKDITDECVFAEELIQQKASINNVHHMRLPRYELKQISGLMKNSSSLRTLLTQPEYIYLYLTQSEHKALMEFKLTSLRAMCCEGLSVLHRELINTTHLRYLDLSRSKIVRLPNLICMLYNLQSLRLNHCKNLQFLPQGLQTLTKLTHIYLLRCVSLKQMPPKLSLLHNLCTLTIFIVDIGDGYGIEELKGLRHLANRLELFNLRKVKSGSKANLHEKNNLTELYLHWGRDLHYNPLHGEVISNNEEEVLESLVPHVGLKSLGVHGYAGISISKWMRDPKMFQCLRELCISNWPSCKDLPLVWLSSSLEKLQLSYMNSLTTLGSKSIDMEAAGYNTPRHFFPKLKIMRLAQLPELERWTENSVGEPNNLLMFPLLEELYINNCNKITTLPEAPSLISLSCHGESAEGLVPMSMVWGSSPSLIHLKFGMLVNVVMPVKEHQNKSQRPQDTLRSLCLQGDNGFISMFNSSKLQLGLADCLAFVERLEIWSCHNIFRWPVEELRCLVRLQSLLIHCCTKLEGKGSSSEEILPLPRLERLEIGNCDSLLEIPKLPTSLGEMGISWCKSLVALPSNLGDLAKLRYLRLEFCSKLEDLPDGMDGLTFLERLRIDSCPGITKFPQGLLQRLPALKLLHVLGCHDLQRRCREGGEHFDLVSLIPDKKIPPPDEAETKKPVKRLLPWCGGDSLSS
ncbi:Disease resistance protein RGA2 [Dichanthelium oligosanthes]|uniref:Disease resistance protein RGA2 n=1 Tax=Dichanthelium oligosanthes TaxID=888268 RepID=A0A1E5V0U2_9POAL|nr:Disease resistance protein RGA2 [Dichanthelium oligosanthes]